MAVRNTPEERQLIKMIGKMPVTDEDKKNWKEQIKSYGLNEELAEEIRVKLTTPSDKEDVAARQARYAIELARFIKRWRFSQQSRNFRKR